MKKIKQLAILSLSTLLLTSCFVDVHREIEREIEYFSTVIVDEKEQESMINSILNAKINPAEKDQHVLSVDIQVNAFNLFNTSLAGYGYYNYNRETDKATFNIVASGLSNLNIALDEDQKMDATLNLANIEILNYEDVQLNFDAKPLNELIDFSLLTNLDKSMIKEYRKTSTIDFENFGFGHRAYVFKLDATKLNELLNSNVKFDSDPVISFLSNSFSFRTIEIVHLSGNVRFNDSINAGIKVFIYNVNPNN